MRSATFTAWLTASVVAMAFVTWSRPLSAQAIQEPAFRFEPGVLTINSVSAPLPTGASTGLNLRFVAEFPTRIPWMTVQVGTSFPPLGLSNGLRDFNDPSFFYGPVIMLLPRDRTANWIELTLPVLGTYHLDENGEADRLYVHDLVVQGGAAMPVGEQLMHDMGGFWQRLTIYGIIQQNLTPSRHFATRRVDRFNPTFFYGVSIPIGRTSEPRGAP